MSEQEVLTHLQEVIKLYRRDSSVLKQLQKAHQELKKYSDENLRKIAELQTENQRLRNVPAPKAVEPLEHEEQPAADIDDFNKWAASPVPVLPSGFSYTEGEFRIRAKNAYRLSSSNGSKWIVNTKGGKKYLLPNPLSFDQMTNISELYAMNRVHLRGKGQNRMRVKKPCEMADNGWIDYPGELQLL